MTAEALWSKCIAENPQKFVRPELVEHNMHYLCGCHEALFEADAAGIDEQIQTTLILDLYDAPEGLCDKMYQIWSEIRSKIPYCLRRLYMMNIVHRTITNLDEEIYAELHEVLHGAGRHNMTIFDFEQEFLLISKQLEGLPELVEIVEGISDTQGFPMRNFRGGGVIARQKTTMLHLYPIDDTRPTTSYMMTYHLLLKGSMIGQYIITTTYPRFWYIYPNQSTLFRLWVSAVFVFQ